MRFSDSINTNIPKPIKYANSDSSSFFSDTSSSDDESYNTTHPCNPDTSQNDTSSHKTISETHDTNPSHTRIRHPTGSSSLPTPNDTSQNRTLESHYLLTTTKGLQTFPFNLQKFELLIIHNF